MQWMILNEDGKIGRGTSNQSKYACHRPIGVLPGLQQKLGDDMWQGRYRDLVGFARAAGFDWTSDGKVAPFGIAPFADRVSHPGDDFSRGLVSVLKDVARVAMAQGFRPPADPGSAQATWWLDTNSTLCAYFLKPEVDEPTTYYPTHQPTRFRRMEIILDKGPAKDGRVPSRFYHWVIEYTDPHQPELSFDQAIRTKDVARASIVKANIVRAADVGEKVWILEGHYKSDKVVVKIENMGSTARDHYVANYDYITWLARKMFEGTPRAQPLTDAEIANLRRLTVPNDDLPQQLLTIATDVRAIVYKMEFVEVGANLMKRMNEIQKLRDDKQDAVADQKLNLLRIFLFDTTKMRVMGRIAVFDLLVNNRDRFDTSRQNRDQTRAVDVAIKNLDFNPAGQSLVIDNINPYYPINENNWHWRGEKDLRDPDGQRQYADLVIQTLIKHTLTPVNYPRAALSAAFLAGMRDGILALKACWMELKRKWDQEKKASHRKKLAETLASRIQALNPGP